MCVCVGLQFLLLQEIKVQYSTLVCIVNRIYWTVNSSTKVVYLQLILKKHYFFDYS